MTAGDISGGPQPAAPTAEAQLANGEAGGHEDVPHWPRDGGGARRGREAARFYPVTKDPVAAATVEDDAGGGVVVRKRKTRHSTNPPVEQHVGWIMDKKAHHAQRERLESLSESVGSVTSSGGGTPQSLPAFHHPSHSLLKVTVVATFLCKILFQ